MKKIFTLSLLCLLSVAAAKAQLQITNGTQEVTNGSVLTFTATEIAEIGLVDCAPSAPKITNVSGEKGTLKVVVKKNSLFDSFDWCGITAQCQPMQSGTETRTAELANSDYRTLDLHANFKFGTYATYSATVTVSFNGTPFCTFMAQYVYADPAGIEAVSADGKSSVRLAGNALRYAFADNAQRTLDVYAADGRLVRTASVNGNGNLSLAGMPKGTYIYCVREAGKKVLDGKCLVK
ncbi:MAG: T9SS type A sorting domain-containing protein [Bacteroidales bacterium]|nr:T9SS type A sorting domain-containing protein [Bacteroidales bacterium]